MATEESDSDSGYFEKRPVKTKDLKIIDYVGIKYATVNGKKVWELDPLIAKLLAECDGQKTLLGIVKTVSEKSGMDMEDIKIGLKKLFEELESSGLIRLV